MSYKKLDLDTAKTKEMLDTAKQIELDKDQDNSVKGFAKVFLSAFPELSQDVIYGLVRITMRRWSKKTGKSWMDIQGFTGEERKAYRTEISNSFKEQLVKIIASKTESPKGLIDERYAEAENKLIAEHQLKE